VQRSWCRLLTIGAACLLALVVSHASGLGHFGKIDHRAHEGDFRPRQRVPLEGVGGDATFDSPNTGDLHGNVRRVALPIEYGVVGGTYAKRRQERVCSSALLADRKIVCSTSYRPPFRQVAAWKQWPGINLAGMGEQLPPELRNVFLAPVGIEGRVHDKLNVKAHVEGDGLSDVFQREIRLQREGTVRIADAAIAEGWQNLDPSAVLGLVADPRGMKLSVDKPQAYPGQENLDAANYNEPIAPIRELPLGLQIVLVALTFAGGIYYLVCALRENSVAKPGALAIYTCGSVAGCGVGIILSLQMVGVLGAPDRKSRKTDHTDQQ